MSWVTNGAAGLFPQAGLDQSQFLQNASGASLTPGIAQGGSIARFDNAMHAASGGAAVQPVQFAQVQQPGTVTDAVPLTPVNPSVQANAPVNETSADRAVRGLDLAQEAEGPGQSILDGLGRLRNIFDSQTNTIANTIGNENVTSAVTMMNLQAEVVRYSVLVDVSSKLAGKSTQALDALMKGQ